MSPEIEEGAPQRQGDAHRAGEGSEQKGYETTDAHAGATIRAGLFVLGTMFLVAAVVVPLYSFFARRETRTQERPATLIKTRPAAVEPSFPRLVVSEPRALSDFRAREDAVLNGYGWVERERGIVHVPVQEAIRIVGARGALPTFAAGPPAEPAGAPPTTDGRAAGGLPSGGGAR